VPHQRAAEQRTGTGRFRSRRSIGSRPANRGSVPRHRRSKAAADQLTTVAKARLAGRLGRLSAADLRAVEDSIRVQLGLPEHTVR
jgi:mRNA-degrading endonuclease toxin of MazEF toxin-antitoxin module